MHTLDDRRTATLGVGLLLAGFLLAFLLIGCDGPTPNPPGPTPDPDPIATPTVTVYVGVYDLLGATGNVDTYLRECKAAGAKGVRLFVCYSWQGPQPISPYLTDGTWTHENGQTFTKYSLANFNPAFWAYLEDVLTACKGHGLTAWIVVEDYCSLKGDQRTKYHNPFYCSNEAGMGEGGDPTPGGVWGEAMKTYHGQLIGRVMESVLTTGVDYLIEPMNEFDIVDGTGQQVIDWHAWAVDEIRKRGVPLARIVGTAGRQASAIAAQVGLYSPHGVGRPDQIVAQPGIANGKIIFSSDGYFGGSGGCDAKGRCGVGLDVANALGLAALSLGAYAIEIIPREVYAHNNDRADVDLFGISKQVVKAIAWAK